MGNASGTDRAIVAHAAIICDKDTNEVDDTTERILNHVYESSVMACKEPNGIARSLPFDYLCPLDQNTGESAHIFFDKLLAAPVVNDSATESNTVHEIPECMQFILFNLPGVVDRDSWDGTPIAAHLWDKYCPSIMYGLMNFIELARAHPQDKFIENSHEIVQGSQCEEGCSISYQPITTKAGSRLWSIGFAQPFSESNSKFPFTQLRASYPLQLLVRQIFYAIFPLSNFIFICVAKKNVLYSFRFDLIVGDSV